MIPPDSRIVAALAAKVLGPRSEGTLGVTPDTLREMARIIDAGHGLPFAFLSNEIGFNGAANILRHIADQLSGPLAEAWERSVDEAIEVSFVRFGLDGLLHLHRDAIKRAALRALEEPNDG